jgi:hypothetical protein
MESYFLFVYLSFSTPLKENYMYDFTIEIKTNYLYFFRFYCPYKKEDHCRAPLQKGCPKHQGHKGDPGVTLGTCGAGGEKAQVILVWVRAPGFGNASHPRRLGFMRVRP